MAKSGKGSRPPTRNMRCAIYTRKSSEEGLEQAFGPAIFGILGRIESAGLNRPR